MTAVQRAGGMALIVPPDPEFGAHPEQVLDLLDGLILAGGADVDPSAYGAEPHVATTGTTPARDQAEIALTERAIERDMPVLGICRGMQLLNVARGGTLDQHLPDLNGHEGHRPSPARSRVRARRAPGLGLAGGARRGAGDALTRQHHHQGVDALGEDLVVTGWADLDELPEAIELPGRRFVLGVQWHPEADPQSPVIEAFVRECAAAKASG